jgi:hypothetical protein
VMRARECIWREGPTPVARPRRLRSSWYHWRTATLASSVAAGIATGSPGGASNSIPDVGNFTPPLGSA